MYFHPPSEQVVLYTITNLDDPEHYEKMMIHSPPLIYQKRV